MWLRFAIPLVLKLLLNLQDLLQSLSNGDALPLVTGYILFIVLTVFLITFGPSISISIQPNHFTKPTEYLTSLVLVLFTIAAFHCPPALFWPTYIIYLAKTIYKSQRFHRVIDTTRSRLHDAFIIIHRPQQEDLADDESGIDTDHDDEFDEFMLGHA